VTGPQTSPRKKRRARRSTGEIVERLMEAAIIEFAEKGYSGATTAAIARRADVAEALLFNHFGSKAQLFKDTMFKPLGALFDRFLAAQPAQADDPDLQRSERLRYIGAVQDLLASHSRMFLSFVFAQSYRTGEIDGLADISALDDYFARSARQAASNLRPDPTIDPELMARISFTAMMACILFQDWLFPQGRWTPEQIRDAISGFVLDGANANQRPG